MRSWRTCIAASIGERIERSLPREPTYRKPMDDNVPWASRPWRIRSFSSAVVTVLKQIYEEDFLGFSYGFRPGRSQHQALDALWVGIMRKKVNWILDADIRGFFDKLVARMAGQVHRASRRRPEDSAPDPEVAEGRSLRGRGMVERRK